MDVCVRLRVHCAPVSLPVLNVITMELIFTFIKNETGKNLMIRKQEIFWMLNATQIVLFINVHELVDSI